MPDPDKATKTEEQGNELEQFAREFHEAKFQHEPPEPPKQETAPAKEEPPPPVAEEPPPPAEPAVSTEPTQPEVPQTKLYTVPDVEMYGALRGKRVTAAQLEEAGLIDKVITRDHQEMHNTKLYQDLKRDFDRQIEERIKAVAQPPQVQPDQTQVQRFDPKTFSDALESTYVPPLKKLAEHGVIEEEFVEAYPRVAAQMAHLRQTAEVVGVGLIQAVNEIAAWAQERESERSTVTAEQHLTGAMEQLSTADPRYAGLGQPEERAAFVEWMRSPDNPQPWKKMKIISELSQPKNLAGAYAAYVLEKNAGAAATAAPVRVATDAAQRAKMATAGGGVSKTRPSSDQTETEFEQTRREFLESQRAMFNRR